MTSRAPLFTGWRGGRRADHVRGNDRAGVRLLTEPARPPATPVERLLVDTLTARGTLARAALVSAVAHTLYRDELARSGWLAALGFFSESVFVAEVTRALDGACDMLWKFEPTAVSG